MSAKKDKATIYHVYPSPDFKEHDTECFGICYCKPRIVKESENGFVVIHNLYINSYDQS